MNPTNPISMHRMIGAEHAHARAAADHRRHQRAALARHAATPRAPRPTTFRAHHRFGMAAATVALLLALLAGGAVASGLAPSASGPGPAPAPQGPSVD